GAGGAWEGVGGRGGRWAGGGGGELWRAPRRRRRGREGNKRGPRSIHQPITPPIPGTDSAAPSRFANGDRRRRGSIGRWIQTAGVVHAAAHARGSDRRMDGARGRTGGGGGRPAADPAAIHHRHPTRPV